MKDPRQRETLKNFKDDIFNETIPVLKTLKKYFRIVKESNTISNIAYTNRTCSDVSARVRKEILRKTDEYEIGEILLCRVYKKTKNVVFNVNYEYEITAIDADSITLDNQHKVPIEVIRSHFIHNYCRT